TEKIKDIEEFIKRISKARNHTRMWVNRGFTPNELYTLHGGLKVNELEVACEGSEKVGRNDPCPCGSGKKYKKCCG
ncbi:MAG: SEC-C metal-binding domain-containing protein, partial [Clostridium sp.]